MYSVDFNYKGVNTTIQANDTDSMEKIFKNFCQKSLTDINSLYFLYGGNKVNEKLKINEVSSNLDKESKKMHFLVFDSNSQIDEKSLKEIKLVVCPICKENCRLHIDDYKIKLFECINGHPSNTILLNEYNITTNIEESEIKCGKCNENNKGKTYNNLFYICLNCKSNLCPLCKSSHDKEHHIINYDDKNYICEKHNESFNSYCNSCKKNICILCENEHINHHIILYSKVISEKEEKLVELNKFRDTINLLKEEVNNITKDLNNFVENVDTLFNINSSIVNHYDVRKRNYQTLTNLSDLKINLLNHEINSIINCKNKGTKCKKMFDIYQKMSNQTKDNDDRKIEKIIAKFGESNEKNEITLHYSSTEEKIKLFGFSFVENNIDNCFIKFEGKNYLLKEFFPL